MLGSGYVIDHCISAFLDYKRHELYQDYIAENLRIIGENTANLSFTGEGKYIKVSFRDAITNKPEREKTGDEIANDIVNLIGR